MLACFYPYENKNILPIKNNYRFIEIIKLIYFINKYKIDYIIKHILTEFCNVSILGYETFTDKYCCKICNRSNCVLLHIELEIIYKNDNISEILIVPLIGNDIKIKNFVKKLNEAMQLYNTSSFVK